MKQVQSCTVPCHHIKEMKPRTTPLLRFYFTIVDNSRLLFPGGNVSTIYALCRSYEEPVYVICTVMGSLCVDVLFQGQLYTLYSCSIYFLLHFFLASSSVSPTLPDWCFRFRPVLVTPLGGGHSGKARRTQDHEWDKAVHVREKKHFQVPIICTRQISDTAQLNVSSWWQLGPWSRVSTSLWAVTTGGWSMSFLDTGGDNAMAWHKYKCKESQHPPPKPLNNSKRKCLY